MDTLYSKRTHRSETVVEESASLPHTQAPVSRRGGFDCTLLYFTSRASLHRAAVRDAHVVRCDDALPPTSRKKFSSDARNFPRLSSQPAHC